MGAAFAQVASSDRAQLEVRLARIEAIKAVERLQNAYGYYQDRFLFAEPPTLFARSGAEVHYDGGVWIGARGVQRLWREYFPAVFNTDGKGPRPGLMLDQPVVQPVVDVAPDGQTAKARFGTIAHYAVYGEREAWVGGIFENDYVREDGIWKIKVMRYCTTWSAPYNRGWIDGAAPQDLPWMRFTGKGRPDRVDAGACKAAYPHAGLVAFHFVHPVTGRAITVAPSAAQVN